MILLTKHGQEIVFDTNKDSEKYNFLGQSENRKTTIIQHTDLNLIALLKFLNKWPGSVISQKINKR